MTEGEESPPDDVVGVVAPDTPDTEGIADAIEDRRLEGVIAKRPDGTNEPTAESVRGVLDADPLFVLAVGDGALYSLVRARVSVPVLPVETDPVPSIDRTELGDALDAIAAGEYTTDRVPVLGVAVDGRRASALADVSVFPTEPAHIAAFSVSIADEPGTPSPHEADQGGKPTGRRFRADGTVVATPVGTGGYAQAVGGPVLSAGSNSIAVVPVAPFVFDIDSWVCEPAALTITIERGTAVELRADDHSLGVLDPGVTIDFEYDDPLSLVRTTDKQKRSNPGGADR